MAEESHEERPARETRAAGARSRRIWPIAAAAVLLTGIAALPSLLALNGRTARDSAALAEGRTAASPAPEIARTSCASADSGSNDQTCGGSGSPSEPELAAAPPVTEIEPSATAAAGAFGPVRFDPAPEPIAAAEPPDGPAPIGEPLETAAREPNTGEGAEAPQETAAAVPDRDADNRAADRTADRNAAAGEIKWWRLDGKDDPLYGRKYYIVIGSLRDLERARSLAARHRDWQPEISEARVEGRLRQRVIVGPFHWRDIEAAHRHIVTAGIPDAWPLPAETGAEPRTLAALTLGR